MKKKKSILFYLIIFFCAVVVDFFTKEWALKTLINKDIKLFEGLNLTFVFNRGVSWGLLSFQSNLAFNILTAFIFLILIVFVVHTYAIIQKGRKCVFFEFLILAGAISNLLDRFLHRGVIDFIDIYIGTWHWPTFNLADIFVVVGVFGILGRFGYLWLYSKRLKN
ncbi:signal peptidase II [Candidatus Babeliales bacterium]|nr:signal peptidase II [Candidatus Babeliales bacterium]